MTGRAERSGAAFFNQHFLLAIYTSHQITVSRMSLIPEGEGWPAAGVRVKYKKLHQLFFFKLVFDKL